MTTAVAQDTPRTPANAFVLGGGGELGGYQVGMVRALLERGIKPDLVIGTSIGSIQGAMLAANPTVSVCTEMNEFWEEFVSRGAMRISPRSLFANAVRLRPSLTSNDALREVVTTCLGDRTRIEELSVPYQCAAASIERATVRYFDSGPLLPAVMASCAVPGLWPPIEIGNEHFIDGGVVETVPMNRAVAYGAGTIYVLRMRQREPELRVPRWPWQLGRVVFEVSRRHRLGHVLNSRPEGVTVHILPSGEESLEPPDSGIRTSEREELATIRRRIDQGYRTTCDYLDAVEANRPFLGKSANPAAVRRTPTASAAAPKTRDTGVPPAVSDFVLRKLHTYFLLYDRDRDGVVSEADFAGAAERITAAFHHPGGGSKAAHLRDAFGTYWQHMCDAADVRSDSCMDRTTFTNALSSLTADPQSYEANLLPAVAAILTTADMDGDGVLGPDEIRRLLRTIGVSEGDDVVVARRLDTNGDGIISLDELSEAFQDYFTSDEPGRVGHTLFSGIS
ncbi:patatin-like phospholipase family protein [Streptomyces sp. NPDC051554]|uniref:patatin-like phospholipase family protein n=1 Tax=Streptomyces sp. NPDC051554 TaxID=3365656 RepID=UPI0037AED33E